MTLRVHGPGIAGKTVHIQSSKCTIGSAAGCTLRLRSAGIEAASCWILRGPCGAVIRRLEGAALLNGESFDEALLEPGDRLQIGSVELELVKLRSDALARPALIPPPPAAPASPSQTRPFEADHRLAEAEKIAALRASELNTTRGELDALRQQLAQKHAADTALRTAADMARRELAAQSATVLRREQELAEARTAAAAERQAWATERSTLEARLAQVAAELQSARAAAFADSTMTVPLGRCSSAESELKTRCTELESQVSRLQAQTAELQGKLGQQADLEQRYKQLSLELDSKCRELAELQVRESAAAARARSQADLDERSEALARWQDELTERGERLTTAEQELNEQRQAIDSQRGALETERRQLAAEQNELTADRQRLLADQQALAADRGSIAAEREAIVAERQALAANQNAHADAESATEKLQARQERLERQADELTQWSNSLAEQAESLNHQTAALETLRQQLEQEQAALAERTRQLEGQAGELEQSKQQLETLRERLDEERAALASQPPVAEQPLTAEQPLATEQRPAEESSAVDETPEAHSTATGETPEEAQVTASPTADAEPPAGRDSSSVDSVLTRLVQAGLWRQDESDESPAAQPPDSAPINHDTAVPARPALPSAEDAPGATMNFDSRKLASAAAHASDDEESIESYMERLMQRVRGDSSAAAPAPAQRWQPATSAPAPSESTTPPEPKPASPAAQAPPQPVEPGEFVPRSTAPELGSNMSAMRELANTAARTAIDHHIRQHTHRLAAGKLLGAGVCLAAGSVLGYTAWQQPSLLTVAGAALSASLAALWLSTGVRYFSRARQIDHSANATDTPAQ